MALAWGWGALLWATGCEGGPQIPLTSDPSPNLGRKGWPAARPAAVAVVVLMGSRGAACLENRGPPRGTDGVGPHPPPETPARSAPRGCSAAEATSLWFRGCWTALGTVPRAGAACPSNRSRPDPHHPG